MTEGLPPSRGSQVLDVDSERFMLRPEAGELTVIVFGLPPCRGCMSRDVELSQAELRSLGVASLTGTIAPAGPAAPRARKSKPPH